MGRRLIYATVVLLMLAAIGGFSATQATAAEEVNVYSSNMQALNELAASEFQKATGIKANMVYSGSGVALKRMRAEKDNPQGDIFWGISKVVLMANVDLLEPYKSKNFDLIMPEFRDPQYRWIGTNLQILVFMYNKNLLKDGDAPKKWSDLLDPKWKNKIAFPNPANSSFAYTTFTMMLHELGNNEAAWKKMENFLANMQITEQSSMVPTPVEKGEFPMGITQEYVATRYVAGGAKVGVIYPEDGNSYSGRRGGHHQGCETPERCGKIHGFLQ